MILLSYFCDDKMAELKTEVPNKIADSLILDRLENVDKELHSIIDELKVKANRKSELEALRNKLDSKEERELTKWSVELGRKAKKGRFKRLLSEMPPEKREELLNSLTPEKREEILK